MSRFNPWVAMLALCVNFLETAYFGWNLHPQSPAEMTWDYISLAILICAWIVPRRD
jgi:hypothetical protein